MPLVPAKCTQCGANLEVDPTKDAAICPACNTPFITEKAINNYNITNVTNIGTLQADVVNIVDGRTADNLYHSGQTHLKMGDWNRAIAAFNEMVDKYPADYRSYCGLIRAETTDLKTLPSDVQKQAGACFRWKALYERMLAAPEGGSGAKEDAKKVLHFLLGATQTAARMLSEEKNGRLEEKRNRLQAELKQIQDTFYSNNDLSSVYQKGYRMGIIQRELQDLNQFAAVIDEDIRKMNQLDLELRKRWAE